MNRSYKMNRVNIYSLSRQKMMTPKAFISVQNNTRTHVPPLIERVVQVEVVAVIALSIVVSILKIHVHRVKWDKHCRDLQPPDYRNE